MDRKQSSGNSIANNSATSVRNIDSILNGTRAFVWSREWTRTDQPYIDHKFHIPFNPPPNEVNFVGGLGTKRGHRRSKVHPNRPTIVQQIYRMRTHNCIDVNFTQSLAETNNCVRKKSTKRIPVRDIVQKISLADIGETNSVDSIESDISENVLLARKVRERIARNSEDATDAYAIDGVPFNVRRHQIRMQVDEIVKTFASQSNATPSDGVLPKESGTFREWLSQLNEKCSPAPAPKRIIEEQDRNSDSSSQKSSTGRAVVKKKKRKSRRCRPNALNRLAGYMNGPFTREKRTDFSSDRFGIPFSMIDRAKKEHEKREIQSNVLRRVRLSHMGYRQPPSKDDSSDNESIQNVKRLALLRTPYFLVPTIKISQVRKKERIRNKFLRKDRLNRINLLLFDRTKKSVERGHGSDGKTSDGEGPLTAGGDTTKVTKKHHYFAKFFQLGPKKKIAPTRDPLKEKYCKIIKSKFEEHRGKCEPNDQDKQRLTFDEFKRRQDTNEDDPIKTVELTPIANNKIETNTAQSQVNREQSIEVGEKLFAAACRSVGKLRRTEPIDGPLYVDPHLNEKVKSPRKFNTRNKYYTNLFKSKFGLRKRLHVNGENFEHGKLGVGRDENFPRLPTEWDDYYVHEMRYRRPTAKFCVKTDILKLREMVRKNFLMYYAQENLFDLKARQVAENRLMDEVEFFAKECDKLFDGWCDEAYSKVFERNEELDAIQMSNAKLMKEKTELFDKCDKLSKEILLNENRWDFLLKIQNYYYLLMDASWREENDWIHRDSENRLLQPLVAIHTCPKRYLRMKAECSADAVRIHFEQEIEPRLAQMKSIEPEAELMTKNLNVLLRKSFVSLEQHNKTIWTYRTIQEVYDQMRHDMLEFEKLQREKINVFQRRLQFALERCHLLDVYNQKIQADLAVAIKNPTARTVMQIIEVLYDRFAPSDRRQAALIDNTSQIDKFKFIHRHCMALLQNLDEIPIEVLTDCEKSVRDRKRRAKEQAKEAIVAQKRLDMFAKQLKQRFMPAPSFRRVQIQTIVQKRIRAAAQKLITPKKD